MRVLGFDTSTVATGYALIDDGVLVESGTIRPVDEVCNVYGTKKAAREAFKDEVARFRYIVNRAAGLLRKLKPDVLVVEDSFMKHNASVLRLLARLSGGILWAWYAGTRYESSGFKAPYLVMASTARAKVGCKGNAKKPEVVKFVNEQYGVEISDDNEADALVLAQYGYKQEQLKTKSRRSTIRGQRKRCRQ